MEYMKKTISVIICFLITLFIGVPVMNSASKYMRAAEKEPDEEFIIDFETVGRASFPVVGSSYIIFAISDNHHLFLKNNTSEWSLVFDESGQPLEDITQVSGGFFDGNVEFMALRKDGSLYVSGVNNGKFGNGEISDAYQPNAVLVNPGISDIVSIKCGYRTNYLVTSNGDVYASGDNSNGQFGNGNLESSSTFVKLNISNVKQLELGSPYTAYALKKDGTVFGWGGWVYDGVNTQSNVLDPIPIYSSNKSDYLENVIAIDAFNMLAYPGLGYAVYDNGILDTWFVGKWYKKNSFEFKQIARLENVSGTSELKNFEATANANVVNGAIYLSNVLTSDAEFYKGIYLENVFGYHEVENAKPIKLLSVDHGNSGYVVLYDNGSIWTGGGREVVRTPLKLIGAKSDTSEYKKSEKYNDNITLTAYSITTNALTCKVENPVGDASKDCENFVNTGNYTISVSAEDNQRIYRKYIVTNDIMRDEFIVDLYKGKPQLSKYSPTATNKIKITDSIALTVPTDQSGWNTYTAKITNSSNQTTEFTGGTLSEGTYTIQVSDAYGNSQDFKFEVSDKPEPTVNFTPSSTALVYKDSYTKVNGTIGNFSLQYPAGEPTSTIASIQLGTSGDESHFSIDTTGALKVNGSDLDADTYDITVSGKDANQMDFTKTVQIVVGKADQNNYQITNNANYSFTSNQEVAITTSGNESGGNETYSITNGNTVAQISNGNKFKILTSGTFTLEATVAGNNNYNSKTVTKQITLSQLPTQTNPIKISSEDSMIYGNTYTPTSTGGTGSGNVTWTIENDSGTGAILNNGSIKVTGIGTFTLKVTKAGDTNYQSSSDSKVITVNKRKTTVKPKDVTRKVGESFKDNGVTYNPQPVAGDHLGTPIITSKYPTSQQAGRYTDGIQVTGLTNPNYDFEYQEGTLVINDTTLPNNGSGYYKIEGTKGKNNWYVSDIKISTLNKDGYDQISSDGINFQTTPITYHTDGDYSITFYLKNSTTGIIARGINYQVKIDQTPPTVPTLTMNQLNTSRMARLINFLSFGNWMNTGAEVIMSSTDGTSGIDNYSYVETDTKGTSNTKTSTTGKVTYQNDVEIGITAKACDKAGNCSDLSASETLMIDRKGPEITGVKDKSVYKYYYLPRFVKVKDNGSGLSYA